MSPSQIEYFNEKMNVVEGSTKQIIEEPYCIIVWKTMSTGVSPSFVTDTLFAYVLTDARKAEMFDIIIPQLEYSCSNCHLYRVCPRWRDSKTVRELFWTKMQQWNPEKLNDFITTRVADVNRSLVNMAITNGRVLMRMVYAAADADQREKLRQCVYDGIFQFTELAMYGVRELMEDIDGDLSRLKIDKFAARLFVIRHPMQTYLTKVALLKNNASDEEWNRYLGENLDSCDALTRAAIENA